ncbi:MAG: 3-isopropylmalate dehydratase [Desulfobacteraceae bacterium]|nr:MAG: 3-isopropylmalate dehydratase [Desulfobacteraceae bacterium]
MSIEGKAWVFGHNIDTDVIVPGRLLAAPIDEAAQHAFEAIAPDFSKTVKPGDLLVAGRNFGCGSSRENAPQVIKHLGIACVLAESFARIFFRNAIAIGLPVLVVEDISAQVKTGTVLSINLERAEVKLFESAEALKAKPLHPTMLSFLKAGGVDGMLKQIREKNNG